MSVPTVTVAIPVYDTVEHLAECLDSVLGQTLRDIEVVCVDDGSSDGSVELLERYAQQDERLTLIRRDGDDRGPGAARNLVIERAAGRYLAFVDSDDVIRPTMLASLVAAAEAHGAEVSMCMLRAFDADGEHLTPCSYDQVIPHSLDSVAFSWRSLGADVFRLRFASCNKIYTRSFLHDRGIRYGEDRYYEDLVFTFRSLLEASALAFVREPLYLNRKERAGATTFLQGDRVRDAIASLADLEQLVRADESFAELLPAFEAFRFRKLRIYLGQNDLANIEPFYEELRRVAAQPQLDDSPFLNDAEQEIRRHVVASDLWSFLVWYVWYLDARQLRTTRRLAKAQAQRTEYRDRVRELRAENQRIRELAESRTLRGRIRRIVGPRGAALLRKLRRR